MYEYLTFNVTYSMFFCKSDTMVPLIIFLTAIASSEVLAKCSLNVESADSPLLATANYESPNHQGHTVTFEENDQFYIKCLPGRSNNQIAENGDQATCEDGSNIRIARTDEEVNYNQLTCAASSNEPPTSIRKTGTICRRTRTELEVGYDIYQDFTKIYTACFDENVLVPIYIQYSFTDLTGSNYENGTFSYFDSGNLYPDIDIDDLYQNQEEILAGLGVAKPSNYKLVPTQILPHFYISYPFDKYASLDYVNVVPMWDFIANVWQNLLRTTLSQCAANSEYFFYGGTLGVDELANDQGDSVSLYLTGEQVPVPRWLWYLSCDNRMFYVLNNPTLQIPDVLDELYQMCANPILSINYAFCQQ